MVVASFEKANGRRRGVTWFRRAVVGLVPLVAALTVLPTAPVGAVVAAPAAPSDVTVSWPGTPGPYARPLVTWTGGGPGEIRWRLDELVAGVWQIGEEELPEPGPAIYLAEAESYCCDRLFRVGVWFIDGGVAGDVAFSPVFDSLAPQRPTVTSVRGWIDGRMTYTWTATPLQADSTPGDPLDVPGPPRYAVVLHPPPLFAPRATVVTTATTATVPWSLSSTAVVEANEWTFWFSASVYAQEGKRPITWLSSRGGRVTASTPAVATYGLPMTITGLTEERHRTSCSACDAIGPSPGRKVVLHARRNALSPWVGVTSTTSDSQGRFVLRVAAPGTRQHRVALLGVPYPQSSIIRVGATSSAAITMTKTRVLASRFLDPTAVRGQKVTAHLSISPSSAVTAYLQRWTGKAWIGVKEVKLARGVGQYTFTAVIRGTVPYRYVVRGSNVPNGLPVAGVITAPFHLTTR